METKPCKTCGADVGPLEQFPTPKGQRGILCLDCYAKSPAGRRMVTADELAQMWGGGKR